MSAADVTLAVLQPGYLPWLGFFDQMRRADVFVLYDDVQFDKHGWRNRNRVKSPSGEPHWLTVPVRHAGRSGQLIRDAEIDHSTPWARKHVGTLRHFYADAPYRDRYLPRIEGILERDWRLLVDLDLALVDAIRGWLGLRGRVERSSGLDVGGARSARLRNLCRHFGATRYLSGDAARDYLDTGLFARDGIDVVWHEYEHPSYPQLHGEFVPYLSILDLLFNCGEESREILRAGQRRPDSAPR